MKGIVFTELCEMIEGSFGIKTLNKVISDSNLGSGGVYSAVGTYDSGELFEMVQSLSKETSTPVPDLVHAYGRYFFDVLKNNYPMFFDKDNAFELLKSIDNHIHVEVMKLYPDAELPKFDYEESENQLILKYESSRSLSLFSLGLIERTIEHYGESIEITHELKKDDGTKAHFTLNRKA